MNKSSNLNKSNIIDENTNILNANESLNYQNKNKIINNENITSNESNKNSNPLKIIFPFKDLKEIKPINEEENIYLNTEYKKIVNEILKKEELNSPLTQNKYLEGEINILDKIIKSHSKFWNVK